MSSPSPTPVRAIYGFVLYLAAYVGFGTFNFGNPAPNGNPFGQGQITPAKQTGFNFMAASTVPVFNFSSSAATPSAFGTPGTTPGAAAFSVGTAEAPRLPRAISKARNRRTRR